ncbi:MAG: hypothetical protein WCK90_04415 [archaeon]
MEVKNRMTKELESLVLGNEDLSISADQIMMHLEGKNDYQQLNYLELILQREELITPETRRGIYKIMADLYLRDITSSNNRARGAEIYEEKLNNPEKAAELYIEQYSGETLACAAKIYEEKLNNPKRAAKLYIEAAAKWNREWEDDRSEPQGESVAGPYPGKEIDRLLDLGRRLENPEKYDRIEMNRGKIEVLRRNLEATQDSFLKYDGAGIKTLAENTKEKARALDLEIKALSREIKEYDNETSEKLGRRW